MKKRNLCFGGAAALLFSLCSCNQEQNLPKLDTSGVEVRRASGTSAEEPTLEQRYEAIDVSQYIDNYPDIFGNDVRVYDDLDAVDNLLGELSVMTFEELRTWSTETGFLNPIIESNIIFDSILNEVANSYGINMNAEYEMSDEERALLYDHFVAKMSEEYPEMCSIDEKYGLCVNPLGSIDDVSTLSNDKGIVIVNKVVYKYQQGTLISCPIDKFVILPEYADISEFIEAYEAGIIPNISEDDVSYVGIVLPQQHTVEDNLKSHVVEREGYRLSVYLTAYPVWSWFDTNIRGKIIITNSYYGSKCKLAVCGTAKYMATVESRRYGQEEYYLFFGKRFDGTYKTKTAIETWYRERYTPTKKTFVTIHDVELSLYQKSMYGIEIRCKH